MSYPSTSPSPADLLADKSWRRRHSAWLLAPILGCGMLSFVGFLYVAIRVQTRKFWIAATIGCVGSAAVWLVMALTGDFEESSDAASTAVESTSSTSDVGAGVAMAVWAALLVYAVVLNRDYLRWRAGLFESQAWYNQPTANAATGQHISYAAPESVNPPQAPGFLGVNQNDYYAALSQPAAPTRHPEDPSPAPARHQLASPGSPMAHSQVAHGRIDVNTASAAALATSLGIDPSLAARVVAVRDRRGGFATLDDLVSAASLQPHELLKFQNKVAFGRAERPAGHQTSTPPPPNKDRPGGRIIDI